MTLAVTQAKAAIEQQLAPIANEVAEIEAKLLELRETKAKLESALAALTGAKNVKAGKSRKQTKPCANQEQVMAVCQVIVQENQPINQTDLEALTKEKLGKEMGYSLSGVQLRLRECLASNFFVLDDKELVSLAAKKTQSVHPQPLPNEPNNRNGEKPQ